MSDLPMSCDLGYPDAEPCNKPVVFYALSAHGPDLWNDTARASLGGYCSREHAELEPRPTVAAARRTYRNVADMTDRRDPVRALWKQLIAAYPDPVPARETIDS